MLGAKTKLSRAKLSDFLALSGQLLQYGFPVQAVFQISADLAIVTPEQFQLMTAQLASGHDFAAALTPVCDRQELLFQLALAERHGDLATCCRENCQLLQTRAQQQRELRQLLAYPLLLLGMLLGMALFVRYYLRPQLADLLPPSADRSPALGWWLILLIGVSLLGYWRWRHVPILTRAHWRQRLPVFGKIWRQYDHYLIFTDLGQLLTSGLALQEILQLVSTIAPRSLQGQLAVMVAAKLKQGRSLATIIAQEPLLPPELGLLLAQNRPRELQGAAFIVLAQQSYQKLNQHLKGLIDQVQPLLFVIIAVIITRLYLQIILPMYRMMKGF